MVKISEAAKYLHLMRIDEQVSLAKVKHLIELEFYYHVELHVLPLNRILLFCPEKGNIIVLNKSGDLIRLKELQEESVQVNATNIVAFSKSNWFVDVYNFELELAHTIRLEKYMIDWN